MRRRAVLLHNLCHFALNPINFIGADATLCSLILVRVAR